MIYIDGWYEGEEGGYKYEVYLRPWGVLWDDVKADYPENLPYYYDWYVSLAEQGMSAPDEIGKS